MKLNGINGISVYLEGKIQGNSFTLTLKQGECKRDIDEVAQELVELTCPLNIEGRIEPKIVNLYSRRNEVFCHLKKVNVKKYDDSSLTISVKFKPIICSPKRYQKSLRVSNKWFNRCCKLLGESYSPHRFKRDRSSLVWHCGFMRGTPVFCSKIDTRKFTEQGKEDFTTSHFSLNEVEKCRFDKPFYPIGFSPRSPLGSVMDDKGNPITYFPWRDY